ncbi:hypothetical protein XPA_005114 [Xanthoria parietina]
MKNKMDLELFFSPVSMICPLVGRHGGETLVVEGGGFSALWGKVTSVFLHRGCRRPSFDDGCPTTVHGALHLSRHNDVGTSDWYCAAIEEDIDSTPARVF